MPKNIRNAVVVNGEEEVKCCTMAELLEAYADGCDVKYYDWGANSERRLELRGGKLYLRGKDIEVVFRDDK